MLRYVALYNHLLPQSALGSKTPVQAMKVVMARNRDQHPESITTVRVTHTEKDRQRFPRPFFMTERQAVLLEDGGAPTVFMSLSVHGTSDRLMTAIEPVEQLCEWIEERMLDAKYAARTCRD